MRCDLCAGDGILLIDLGKQPLANKYPTREEFEAEKFFPLDVYWCTSCRAAYLNTRVSRSELFETYYYLSSVNQGLVRHFESLADRLSGASFVLDIGSNDGVLLKPLKERGIRAVGIDPSQNVAQLANSNGLETVVGFFDEHSVARIVEAYGKPDVVVASSVFTHVDDPARFLKNVHSVLTDSGTFILEVEYVRSILDTLQFERFYLDRVFYYSIASLIGLLASAGLRVTDAELIETHGGSLRITAVKKDSASESSRLIALIAEEKAALTEDRVRQFSARSKDAVIELKHALEMFRTEGARVAGYGAPARVSTITNLGRIGPELIEYIVDDSPLKQHRYSPGMHIPILPASMLSTDVPQALIVFAYEYLDDIRKKTADSYRYFNPIPFREVS